MNIQDERDFRERLDGVLDTVTPSPAPVSAAVRQGKIIKMRRWASAAAGLAVVAVLVVAVPGILHRALAPAAAPVYRVTVTSPGPDAPAGLIASGTINARHWKVVAAPPHGGNQCFGFGGGNPCATSGPAPAAGQDPAVLESSDYGNGEVYVYGAVRREVSSLGVVLGNGTVLTLHPVSLYGKRYVAFAVPSHLDVTRVIAYSRGAELAYAVPFPGFGDVETIGWRQAGEHVPGRVTVRIGSGVAGGASWSEFAYVGSWGRCFGGAGGGSSCVSGYGSLLSPGQLTAEMFISVGGSGNAEERYYVATAAPSVGYLRMALSDGSKIRVQARDVLGQKFYVLAVPGKVNVLSWTAYSASGAKLGTGGGFTG